MNSTKHYDYIIESSFDDLLDAYEEDIKDSEKKKDMLVHKDEIVLTIDINAVNNSEDDDFDDEPLEDFDITRLNQIDEKDKDLYIKRFRKFVNRMVYQLYDSELIDSKDDLISLEFFKSNKNNDIPVDLLSDTNIITDSNFYSDIKGNPKCLFVVKFKAIIPSILSNKNIINRGIYDIARSYSIFLNKLNCSLLAYTYNFKLGDEDVSNTDFTVDILEHNKFNSIKITGRKLYDADDIDEDKLNKDVFKSIYEVSTNIEFDSVVFDAIDKVLRKHQKQLYLFPIYNKTINIISDSTVNYSVNKQEENVYRCNYFNESDNTSDIINYVKDKLKSGSSAESRMFCYFNASFAPNDEATNKLATLLLTNIIITINNMSYLLGVYVYTKLNGKGAILKKKEFDELYQSNVAQNTLKEYFDFMDVIADNSGEVEECLVNAKIIPDNWQTFEGNFVMGVGD